MAIKILLAFSSRLVSEGIGRLLEGDPETEVVSILEPGETYCASKLEKFPAGAILITDFTSLYNSFPGADEDGSLKRFHTLLIDTSCGSENLVTAVLNKKLSGVLLNKSDSAILRKALRAIHKGDIWIDRSTFKSILRGVNAVSEEKNSTLSSREKEIVSLIGLGLRNKEVGSKLNISETTVKSHLSRIFQKLNIKSRSELISYAIKLKDMQQIPASIIP